MQDVDERTSLVGTSDTLMVTSFGESGSRAGLGKGEGGGWEGCAAGRG